MKFSKISNMKIFLLLFFMISTTFVEIISIGSIYPLLTSVLLTEGSFPQIQNEFILYLSTVDPSLIIIVILFLFILRFILVILSTWYQSNISETIIINISSEIFRGYQEKNVKLLESQKLSDLIRIVVGSVNQVISSYLLQIIIIFFEIITLILIGTTILYLIGSLQLMVALILCFIVLLLFRYINIQLVKLGNLKKKSESEKMELVNDSISLSREIRNFRISDYFLNKFFLAAQITAKVTVRNQVFAILPRNIFELILVLASMLYLYFIILTGQNLLIQIPIIGTTLFAFLRALPSLNKLMVGFQKINFSKVFVDEVLYELSQKSNFFIDDKLKIENFKKIEFRNVSVNFESEKLGPWSFEINKNEWVLLSGPSGLGKSTILDIISGHQEFEGEIDVDGQIFKKILSFNIQKIGYVPQKVHLIKNTLKENVGLYNTSLYNRINKIIKDTSLTELESLLKNNFDADKISGGQRQRVGIARALLINPQILILDESTSALDKNLEEEILNNLKKEKNITLIMTSHSSRFENYFDRKITIKKLL